MTPSTLITMVVGLLIPALVALVTKESLPARAKVLIVLLLTTASGVLSGIESAPPSSLSGWEHVVLNILMTYVSAAAATVAPWIPGSTFVEHIERLTSDFGIGSGARRHDVG